MAESQKRKEDFFDALHQQYYEKLLRQANGYFGYRKRFYHLAENAVQETFFIAFQAHNELSVHPNPEAWLRFVLRRRLYHYLQAVKADQTHTMSLDETQLCADVEADGTDAIEQFIQNEDNCDLVHRLMKLLNEKEKNLLRLFYFEKKRSAEIAALYNTTDKVVNIQLHRIRKKLKKIFEKGILLLICLFCFYI